MAIIEWRPEYSVGIGEIDRQHKKLVGMLDDLFVAMREKKGNQAVGSVLNELLRYCAEHFKYEESLMQKHGYPAHDEHKGIHGKMAAKAGSLAQKFQSGSAPSPVEVSNFLKDWLTKHIQGTDMKYSGFFKQKGLT